MDVKPLLWEGPNPVTPPNMGRSVSFAWCLEDWRKFELSVRAAYPNVFSTKASKTPKSPAKPNRHLPPSKDWTSRGGAER
jgi:hypothetical protein